MFADEELVKSQRKAKDCDDNNEAHCVNDYLKRCRTSQPFSEVAQLRGECGSEKKDRDSRADQKIPEQKPIADFEISIGLCALIRGKGIQPGLGCLSGIERLSDGRRCRC